MIQMKEKLTALFIGIHALLKHGSMEAEDARTRSGFNTFIMEKQHNEDPVLREFSKLNSLLYFRAIQRHTGGNF